MGKSNTATSQLGGETGMQDPKTTQMRKTLMYGLPLLTPVFIGFAPADDPEIVIGVYLFGLNSFISGSRAAGPAFSELTTFARQNQSIAPTGQPGRELENEW